MSSSLNLFINPLSLVAILKSHKHHRECHQQHSLSGKGWESSHLCLGRGCLEGYRGKSWKGSTERNSESCKDCRAICPVLILIRCWLCFSFQIAFTLHALCKVTWSTWLHLDHSGCLPVWATAVMFKWYPRIRTWHQLMESLCLYSESNQVICTEMCTLVASVVQDSEVMRYLRLSLLSFCQGTFFKKRAWNWLRKWLACLVQGAAENFGFTCAKNQPNNKVWGHGPQDYPYFDTSSRSGVSPKSAARLIIKRSLNSNLMPSPPHLPFHISLERNSQRARWMFRINQTHKKINK